MPRPATGSIEEHEAKDGRVYRYLRFAANGKRQTLRLGAVTREEAERQLSYVMADVARGTWRPPVPAPKVLAAEAGTASTFHGFANEWWLLNQAQLAAKTREDYTWRLQKHLLPYFGEMRLDAITFNTVERYIAAKLAEAEKIRDAAADGRPLAEEITDKRGRTFIRTVRPLSARAINMTVTLLAAILESAVERELITRNPAKGKRRRVRERAPARSHLEEAAQIEALLDAAGELDRDAQEQGKHIQRRAMIATLTFAGLRIGELLALRWRDVNLAGGWLTVGDSKTDAGRRKVKVRGALRDELLAVRASGAVDQHAPVFATRTGKTSGAHNVRNRVLAPAVKRANENLAKQGLPPLPERLTPHSLRRTFASVLYALGESPPVVMAEMGHTDAALALRVYAQAMRRSDAEQAQLRALVEGVASEPVASATAGASAPI